jgi:hypothetical protein
MRKLGLGLNYCVSLVETLIFAATEPFLSNSWVTDIPISGSELVVIDVARTEPHTEPGSNLCVHIITSSQALTIL